MRQLTSVINSPIGVHRASCSLRAACACVEGCNILMMQKVDDSSVFDRVWADYKTGFGGADGNYWMGNDRIHQLTMSGRYKLRVELQTQDESSFWAEYNVFLVAREERNYKVTALIYSAGDSDMLRSMRGNAFSTSDNDNDDNVSNCAQYIGGGFWYDEGECDGCFVTGRGDNFNCYLATSTYPMSAPLKTARMWLQCM